MGEIFISYKTERREFVRRLSALVEANGFETFWDHELVAGPSYTWQLENSLRSSKCVLVLWCSGSRISPYVLDEARRARALGKNIPILIEAVEPPLGFGTDQLIDLSNWRGQVEDANLDKVIQAAERLVGRPRRPWTNVLYQLSLSPPLVALEPIHIEDAEPSRIAIDDTGRGPGASGENRTIVASMDSIQRFREGDSEMPIINPSVEDLLQLVSSFGYPAEKKQTSQGVKYGLFKMSGLNIVMSAFPRGEQEVRSVQFSCGFTKPSGNAKEACETFNRDYRFAKAYIDSDGDLMIEMDFFVNGLSTEGFESYLSMFDRAVSKLKDIFAE